MDENLQSQLQTIEQLDTSKQKAGKAEPALGDSEWMALKEKISVDSEYWIKELGLGFRSRCKE